MKALKQNLGLTVIIVAMFLTVALVAFLEVQKAYGNITSTNGTGFNSALTFSFFASTTNQTQAIATTTVGQATSTNIVSYFDTNGVLDKGSFNIQGAKKVTFYFGRGATSTNNGNSSFRVQVTPDGTNWYYWNAWIENASSTAGTVPMTNSIDTFTIGAGTSTIVEAMILKDDQFQAARCISTIVQDGNNTCVATATY